VKTHIEKIMTKASFIRWTGQLALSIAAVALIKRIRASEPFRRTKGRFNVRGSYPSTKMGRTIQFESHRCELSAILEFEHDSHVREYWDQPGQIKLNYQKPAGGKGGHLHVPDFFVLGDNFAGWVECKTEDEITELADQKPFLYVRGADRSWSCPPGEAYAASLGMTYKLYIAGRKGAALTRNLTFLDD
jgi:putative transposase